MGFPELTPEIKALIREVNFYTEEADSAFEMLDASSVAKATAAAEKAMSKLLLALGLG